ncbi:sensor histidine kinase [Fictibacillus sp. 7GRE50]|uniref:sensor histidine kinase n=1 Tax=Fictibacillus sp. 7GRE50 TaxID=2745878 RepID=UPI0018CC9550|nr:sensor histidine kinase [Fictibacillus sp. 7GRE50]MBH0167062.1 sensor histidine kinase [Fictibacillus sp. 7GRE50]
MNRIQKKIWMLASVVLIIMAIIWIALTYYNQKTQNQYNDILQRYLSMNEVTSSSQQVVTDLNNYLLDPSEENVDKLNQSKVKLNEAKGEIGKLRNSENEFALMNYMNLIDSLIETTDRSLMFYEESDTETSNKEFTEATRLSKYISEMTLTLIDTELKTYDVFYRGIIDQSAEFKKLGIWLMLLITLLLLVITYWFSLSITRPVQQLTRAANELSAGKFDKEIKVESNDEISFLAQTFNRMRININNLFQEIQQKAQLEHELQQNKLLLQESQLKNLQSQINPHFLFNTLNTLSKKAYLEGSEETSDLLVSVAGLLRYNLKWLDKSVTLQDEVMVIQQYMNIQKARFTDRLTLHLDIDQSCLEVQLPGLTLQPIIENAVIYAVEPREDGGQIWLRIIDDDNMVMIEVEDDGPGIPENIRRQILNGELIETNRASTGIGFTNVVKRLRLFYGMENLMDIQSEMGEGTKVLIRIPKKREMEQHAQTLDR